MKLNKQQKYALMIWLGEKVSGLFTDASVVSGMDEFAKGEIREWRIIYVFGLAGKIWNIGDLIYLTGYSEHEIGKRAHESQQKIIEKWNEELLKLIALYS